MRMIQNEVLDEKTTENPQSGIQARSGRIGCGTWLQLCSRGTQFGLNGALIGRWQRQLEGHAPDAFPAYGPAGLIFVLATEGNPRHKRSHLIPLTSKRRALFRKIRERDTKIVKQMLSHVSETDRRVTQKTLETLLAQLK